MSGWSKSLAAPAPGIRGRGRRPARSAENIQVRLTDLDVAEPVAELMIAHKRADLVRRYTGATLIEQRRRAAATYDDRCPGCSAVAMTTSETSSPAAAGAVRNRKHEAAAVCIAVGCSQPVSLGSPPASQPSASRAGVICI